MLCHYIDYECHICIDSDATSPGSAGCCVCNIDCECHICFGRDATSPGSESLNRDDIEINQPSDFHVLDDPQLRVALLNASPKKEFLAIEIVENKGRKVFDKGPQRGETWLETAEVIYNSPATQLIPVNSTGKGQFSELNHNIDQLSPNFGLTTMIIVKKCAALIFPSHEVYLVDTEFHLRTTSESLIFRSHIMLHYLSREKMQFELVKEMQLFFRRMGMPLVVTGNVNKYILSMIAKLTAIFLV
ncbi:hypothetical protein HAX54_037372 [Datura stramonium]|uniref:Uncharacterized protein n=1 Tax=Datura stramonium TaxID=4076 RepID=A0ABS8SH31_DATST|nr:hypothetical protein [Datura stramonium]